MQTAADPDGRGAAPPEGDPGDGERSGDSAGERPAVGHRRPKASPQCRTPAAKKGRAPATPEETHHVFVATPDGLRQASAALGHVQSVALDLEACRGPDDDSCFGPLSLLQLALPRGSVFLIDVLALGPEAVGAALRRVVESPHVTKLMYDCRRDAQALFRQLGLRPAAVVDLQLYVAYVRHPRPSRDPPRLGLSAALQDYLRLDAAGRFDSVTARMKAGQPLWETRPLDALALQYAAGDVRHLHALYHVLRKRNAALLQPTKRLSEQYVAAYARGGGDVAEEVNDDPRRVLHHWMQHCRAAA